MTCTSFPRQDVRGKGSSSTTATGCYTRIRSDWLAMQAEKRLTIQRISLRSWFRAPCPDALRPLDWPRGDRARPPTSAPKQIPREIASGEEKRPHGPLRRVPPLAHVRQPPRWSPPGNSQRSTDCLDDVAPTSLVWPRWDRLLSDIWSFCVVASLLLVSQARGISRHPVDRSSSFQGRWFRRDQSTYGPT